MAKDGKDPKRRRITFGTAWVALAVAAGVVTSCGGDDEPTAATVTTAAPDGDGPTTTEDALTTTTAAPTGARGLAGTVEVVAGNGSDDSAGRPGPATDASLGSNPRFAVAPNGDLFVISPAPIVLLVRDGTISEIYSGGVGEFAFGGVAVGPEGNAYVTMSTGVKRISADGSSALVLDAQAEGIGGQFGAITFDDAGSFYFWDKSTARVLRRAADGVVSPVAGTGTQGPPGQPPAGDGGPATAAPLSAVEQLVVDGQGNLLIADTGQGVVRSVAADGTISTIAGGGDTEIGDTVNDFAPDGTAATDLKLGQVNGVTVDADGRVYLSDGGYHVIIRFEPGGGIEIVAGDQRGVVEEMGHPASDTRVTNVGALAIDAGGDLLFLDRNFIRRIQDAAG
jgi:hypothetical protein